MSSHRAPTRSLGELLARQAHDRPEAPALLGDHGRATFLELDRAAARVAHALRARGLVPGDRVAALGRDGLPAFEALFGCARAGLVWMGVNVRLAAPEVAFILQDSGAAAVFVDASLLPLVRALRPELPALRLAIVTGDAPAQLAAGEVAHGALKAEGADGEPVVPPGRDDVAVQMYTSGTTGRPKGVMLAHRSFFAVVAAMAAAGDGWIGFSPRDVTLHALPLFHIGGLWWAATSLDAGAPLLVLDAFTPSGAVAAIARHRVTKACLVPAMMAVMLAEPAATPAAFASLDCIVYGGSPIPAPLLQRAVAGFGCRFAQIYGLTETGNTAVCLRPEDHLDLGHERVAAAGRPYPGVELAIVDERGRPLPPRAVGQILVRSPANMLGYWNRPEATAETLVDGWVATGDAGFLDEDGYVYVRDRLKDMIISAGENVYPAEIESVLCAHPGVAEAAVIGVPDERWGEAIKALVVKRPGAEVRVRELLAHVRARLAAFKVPGSVEFVATLPRTPSGKLKKAELREPYWRGRARRVN